MKLAIRAVGITDRKLRNLHLKIKSGEIYGILGEAGAGKTTLLQMLCGATFPAAGRVELFGKPLTVQNRRNLVRHVGVLIGEPAFYEHLSVEENMRIHAAYFDLGDDAHMHRIFKDFGLFHLLRKRAGILTRTERQMVGIARAFLTKPALILLDEPVSFMDPAERVRILSVMERFRTRFGITFVLSGQHLAELRKMTERIGILQDGRITREFIVKSAQKRTMAALRPAISNLNGTDYGLARGHSLADLGNRRAEVTGFSPNPKPHLLKKERFVVFPDGTKGKGIGGRQFG